MPHELLTTQQAQGALVRGVADLLQHLLRDSVQPPRTSPGPRNIHGEGPTVLLEVPELDNERRKAALR